MTPPKTRKKRHISLDPETWAMIAEYESLSKLRPSRIIEVCVRQCLIPLLDPDHNGQPL